MKVIILAGGFGTRLSEYTGLIPKPLVEIGGKPIIWHIMKLYSRFGFNDFTAALGYKGNTIKKYFIDYKVLNSDFSIDLKTGNKEVLSQNHENWKVTLIDTGIGSMTGGRLKRLKNIVGSETFMLTYGDGVSDINIKDLVDFHKEHGKIATVTAVRPSARFGEMVISEQKVSKFKEKPQIDQGWVNGGFFVFEPEIFNYLENDFTVLEGSPLEKLAEDGELMAFKHNGFWQCMDTKRDCDYLNDLCQKGAFSWYKPKLEMS